MERLRKFFKFLTAFAFFIFASTLFFVMVIAHFPKIEKADAIIILGAAINTPALTNRSLEGLRLYKDGKGEVLVLSGGRISDKDISEAGYMKQVIAKNSARLPNIILEENSHSTYENIKNSKVLLPNARSVIIVSDKFHLARAVLMAKRNGYKKVYWSGPDPSYYKDVELMFYYLRETVAMIAYIPKFVLN